MPVPEEKKEEKEAETKAETKAEKKEEKKEEPQDHAGSIEDVRQLVKRLDKMGKTYAKQQSYQHIQGMDAENKPVQHSSALAPKQPAANAGLIERIRFSRKVSKYTQQYIRPYKDLPRVKEDKPYETTYGGLTTQSGAAFSVANTNFDFASSPLNRAAAQVGKNLAVLTSAPELLKKVRAFVSADNINKINSQMQLGKFDWMNKLVELKTPIASLAEQDQAIISKEVASLQQAAAEQATWFKKALETKSHLLKQAMLQGMAAISYDYGNANEFQFELIEATTDTGQLTRDSSLNLSSGNPINYEAGIYRRKGSNVTVVVDNEGQVSAVTDKIDMTQEKGFKHANREVISMLVSKGTTDLIINHKQDFRKPVDENNPGLDVMNSKDARLKLAEYIQWMLDLVEEKVPHVKVQLDSNMRHALDAFTRDRDSQENAHKIQQQINRINAAYAKDQEKFNKDEPLEMSVDESKRGEPLEMSVDESKNDSGTGPTITTPHPRSSGP